MFREPECDTHISPQTSKATSETPSPDTQSVPDPRSTVNPDIYNHRHYESGYGTDYSPLSFGSPAQFTFNSEADDNVFELSHDITDLHLDEQLGEHLFPFENESNADRDADGVDDSVSNDQEVEHILSEANGIGPSRTVSDPIDIKRKRSGAPTPCSVESDETSNQCVESVSDYMNFAQEESKQFTCSSRNNAESSLDGCRFCLSTSQRSVATQTPPSMLPEADHYQCLHRSEETLHLPRGQPLDPLDSSHFQTTESDVQASQSAQLPDVVPFQRNRSASLPAVQALRHSDGETLGRTLRRISDEFEFYHRERRRQQRALSLPHTPELWNVIRRYFISGPAGYDRGDDEHSQKDILNNDGD